MLSKYHYYTGVIFKVYTYGVGEPVAKGGRYDQLLGYFGKEAPAIGFAVVVDDLLAALERQRAKRNTTLHAEDEVITLLYQPHNFEDKLAEAKDLRKQGKRVALVPETEKNYE